jgi:hypothetical protein
MDILRSKIFTLINIKFQIKKNSHNQVNKIITMASKINITIKNLLNQIIFRKPAIRKIIENSQLKRKSLDKRIFFNFLLKVIM